MNKPDLNARIKKLKKIAADFNAMENILIFKEEDIFYLTGFSGKDSNSALLITGEKNYLFVNFIYFEDAKNSVDRDEIEVIKYQGEKESFITAILTGEKIRSVLIQSNYIYHNDYSRLESILKNAGINSKGIEYPLSRLRLIKDITEQELIRKACRITDDSFSYIRNMEYEYIKNIKDSFLAIEIEKFMLGSGGTGKSFDYVIAVNENSSKPHHVPRNDIINDAILLMDYGLNFHNYCTDFSRTIFIGKDIKPEIKKIYEIVKEAQQRAVESCREGITAKELDGIARKYIAEKGYGEYFGHSLGHGIGLEIHEPPWVNQNNEQTLMEGMVITIEPGIYIENLGGVRIEDMVIVKKNNCENLYRSSRDLIQIY